MNEENSQTEPSQVNKGIDFIAIFKNFIERALAVAKSPKTELEKVALEQYEPKLLVFEYLLPGFFISAVAGFVGLQIFGFPMPGENFHPEFFAAFCGALVQILFGVITVIVYGFVLSKVSSGFSGKADFASSLKLLTFAALPGLLASVLNIYPLLGIIGVFVGSYCSYIYYIGLDKILVIEKKLFAFFVSIVGFLITGVILAIIFNMLTLNFFPEDELNKKIEESTQELMDKYGIDASKYQKN